MPDLTPDRFERGHALFVGGLRRHHAFTNADAGIPRQWADLQQRGPVPGRVSRMAYGVMCRSHAEGFEYMAGVEVAAFDGLPDAWDRMRIPEQTYAVFRHDDHAGTLRQTWQQIWATWLPASGFRPAPTPDFERYGPDYDPRTGEGGIEIWFPIVGS